MGLSFQGARQKFAYLQIKYRLLNTNSIILNENYLRFVSYATTYCILIMFLLDKINMLCYITFVIIFVRCPLRAYRKEFYPCIAHRR